MEKTSDVSPSSSNAEPEQLRQNIEAVLEFYTREEQKISRSQRFLERVSHFLGRPIFLSVILFFVMLWILTNILMSQFGHAEFDPPPFSWLQGVMSFSALVTTSVVLIRQNRLAKIEEQRAHLDLKVTLLTEQKAAKIIDMLEELRRDLPNVRNRIDPEVVVLHQSMNPDQVLAALDERAEADMRLKNVNTVETKESTEP